MSQLICWLLVGLVHLIPALALDRPELITRLYGVAFDSPLLLLMDHRAALFFAVLVTCLWAAFDPDGRKIATMLVAISMLGFLFLYQSWAPGPFHHHRAHRSDRPYPTRLGGLARFSAVGNL